MKTMMVMSLVAFAAAAFGETVDVKVETIRADKSCKVEMVPVEVKDGTAHFIWPRSRIPSDAVCVNVKPMFSTARKGEDGYYVHPSGALCSFRLDKGHFAQHKNWFPMPVYGMKTPRATFVAIVTGMKYEFSLVADVKDGTYSCFTAFDMDVAHAYEDIAIDYVFLSGDDANYSGMARTYRRYQLESGACRPISERIKTNKALAYAVQAPEVRIRQAWKPAPSPVPDQTELDEPPVTAYVTFDRVKEIIDACDAAGVGKVEYCLVGWNYRGHDGRWPQMFPVEPLLGGETKLRELIAYSLAKGHPIVGHANYRDAYLIADTFDFEYCQDRKDDGTMTDAKREAWSGGRCFRVCPRRAYEKYAIKHTAAMKALGFRGLGYIDVTSSRPLFACTDPRHPLNNAERAVWEKAILRLQSDAFGGSASEGGFDWCIGEVDSALTVVFADPFNYLPSGKKWHTMIDRYVPFWQIVYHGIVLSTPFRTMWNIEAKPDKWRYRLCAAEYGNRPTFYYYGRWNRPDEPDIHCGTAEELEASVRVIKEGADDYASRSDLQYHFMDRHDILGDGLARTTYSNGARLYVNYSDSPRQMDGVTVPARDYIVVRRQASPTIRWATPVDVGPGGYARAHRLNDGRVMLAYCGGTCGWMRMSEDMGATWSTARRLVDHDILKEGDAAYTNFVGNIDFAQLPADHAAHPNRIVVSFNYRCRNKAKRPLSIHEMHSDDNGATWSAPRLLFTANATEGVYEPFVHVAGNGTLEIYTADESEPTLEKHNQRIAKHVSTDGGDTWGAAQTVCSSMSSATGWSGRDGMPAVIEWRGHTYLAIESRGDSRHLHPRVLTDGAREVPLAEDVPADMVGGSPYIAATENFLLLCWQQQPASDKRGSSRRVVVAAAPKAEVPASSGSVAGLFRGKSTPPLFCGPSERGSMWNALCPLEGDDFLLVTARSYADATGKVRQRVFVTRASCR